MTKECDRCGRSEGTGLVRYSDGGRERARVLCEVCKDELLERRRVKVSRRPTRTWFTRVGVVLIALGLAALLITIAIGIGSALFGGDDGPCRPNPQTGVCRN